MENDALDTGKYIQRSITITPEQLAKLQSYKTKGYNVSQIVRYIIDMMPEHFNEWSNFQITQNTKEQKHMKTKEQTIIANLQEQNDILKSRLQDTMNIFEGWKEWKEEEINQLLHTLQTVKSDLDDFKEELDDTIANHLDNIFDTLDECEYMSKQINYDENTKEEK